MKLKYIVEEVMILKEKVVLDVWLKLLKVVCEVEMNEKKIEVMWDVYIFNKEDLKSFCIRCLCIEEYIRNFFN